VDIKLLAHQKALITAIHKYTDITYFIDLVGYGGGKSTAVVYLLLLVVHWYGGQHLSFGIGGASIKHLRETVISDFVQMMDRHGIAYKLNVQEGTVRVGTLTFVYFSLDRPDTIFGLTSQVLFVTK
jgi:hypothetical protein